MCNITIASQISNQAWASTGRSTQTTWTLYMYCSFSYLSCEDSTTGSGPPSMGTRYFTFWDGTQLGKLDTDYLSCLPQTLCSKNVPIIPA